MGVYNRAKFKLINGTLDLDAATPEIRILLLKSSAPAFNPDHNVVNDLVPGTNEVSVAGYSRKTLASVSVTEDDTSDFAKVAAADVTFATLATGQTIGAAVVYKRAAAGSDVDANDEVIAHYSLGAGTPTNGGDVVIQWNAGGFLQVT